MCAPPRWVWQRRNAAPPGTCSCSHDRRCAAAPPSAPFWFAEPLRLHPARCSLPRARQRAAARCAGRPAVAQHAGTGGCAAGGLRQAVASVLSAPFTEAVDPCMRCSRHDGGGWWRRGVAARTVSCSRGAPAGGARGSCAQGRALRYQKKHAQVPRLPILQGRISLEAQWLPAFGA